MPVGGTVPGAGGNREMGWDFGLRRAQCSMALWRVREFHQADLDAVVRIWDAPKTGGLEPVFGLSERLAAIRGGQPTVVATVGEEVVGSAVGTVSGEQAWILRVGLATAWRQRGIGSALLTELERRLFGAGANRTRSFRHGRR